MTEKDFKRFMNACERGKFILVSVNAREGGFDDMPSILTELGGEYCHVEIIESVEKDCYGNVVDVKVISANGEKVAKESILKYKKHLEETDLYLADIADATDVDREAFVKYHIDALGDNYDKGLLVILARKTLLTRLWGIGFLFNKFVYTTPPFSKKIRSGWICSKICAASVRSRFPDFLKNFWLDYITPSIFASADELSIWRP